MNKNEEAFLQLLIRSNYNIRQLTKKLYPNATPNQLKAHYNIVSHYSKKIKNKVAATVNEKEIIEGALDFVER